MNGSLFPAGAFAEGGFWQNALENPLFVHAFHRTLAWGVLAATLGFALALRSQLRDGQTPKIVWGLVAAVAAQITLGALTVIWAVPVAIASAHQATAVIVLLLSLAAAHRLRASA